MISTYPQPNGCGVYRLQIVKERYYYLTMRQIGDARLFFASTQELNDPL